MTTTAHIGFATVDNSRTKEDSTSPANLTFVKRSPKIFSVFHLNPNRLFVKLVDTRKNMITIDDMTSRFTTNANVGNLILGRLIVVNGIIKPEGASMV